MRGTGIVVFYYIPWALFESLKLCAGVAGKNQVNTCSHIHNQYVQENNHISYIPTESWEKIIEVSNIAPLFNYLHRTYKVDRL